MHSAPADVEALVLVLVLAPTASRPQSGRSHLMAGGQQIRMRQVQTANGYCRDEQCLLVFTRVC